MELAKESYKEDILNGFDLLHIDPTKDPDEMCKVVDINVVFRRYVLLVLKIREPSVIFFSHSL